MKEKESEKTGVKANIVLILDKLHIKYEEMHHKPVFTMEEAEAECGHRPEEGVKTLALKSNEGDLTLAVLRADSRLDFKNAAKVIGTKKVRMASPEDLQRIDVQTGGLTPFGYLTKMDVLYDSSIEDERNVYINPGVNDSTFKLTSRDLYKAIKYWAKSVKKLD